MPAFLDQLAATRDRLVGSARFRRWAAAFPLTRPIARRRARALFDLCAGFVHSQVLLACVRLKLFELLREAPRTAEEVARTTDIPLDAANTLLQAAVTLQLASRRAGGRYGLGTLGAAMIDNPGIEAMVEHNALLYSDLDDPVALLRRERGDTRLGRYWAYARNSRPQDVEADRVAGYTQLMSASQSLIADQVLDAYPLDRHRCLLDVGGGDGTFIAAAARRCPRLELMLFDLPAVAALARRRLSAAGLGGRATVSGGDFARDALPAGADVISLVRVVHDHDDDVVRALLGNVRAALPGGGTLLLAEPMSDTSGAEAMAGAYFGLYLLAMGSGKPRSAQTLRRMLQEAGFNDIRRVGTAVPLQTSLLVARC